jgi:hypothetical protein
MDNPLLKARYRAHNIENNEKIPTDKNIEQLEIIYKNILLKGAQKFRDIKFKQ